MMILIEEPKLNPYFEKPVASLHLLLNHLDQILRTCYSIYSNLYYNIITYFIYSNTYYN